MLIEKVKNPFHGNKEYRCFGCSDQNRKGLHLVFFKHNDLALTLWEPDPDLQGYFNVLHGGIQATLADELGAWWIYLHAVTTGMTMRLEMRYKKKMRTDKGKIFIVAKEKSRRRNIISISAGLYNSTAELCSHAELDYFVFSEHEAKRKLKYPGVEAFAGEMVESSDYGFPDKLFIK